MSRREVENPMVTGAGFSETEPLAICPHCGDGWFPAPDGGFRDGSLWAPWPLTFSGRYCLACVASACGSDQALMNWYDQEGEESDLFRFFLGDQPIRVSEANRGAEIPRSGMNAGAQSPKGFGPRIALEGLGEEARLVIGLLRRHEAELFHELLREYAHSPGPRRRNAWISYLWAVC